MKTLVSENTRLIKQIYVDYYTESLCCIYKLFNLDSIVLVFIAISVLFCSIEISLYVGEIGIGNKLLEL